MQRMTIRSFGPVKEAHLQIDDILLFIGPQASGKSTISKTIYFFKSLKDDLIRYIVDSLEENRFDRPLGTFAKRTRAKFLNFWGPTLHLTGIYLKYEYSPDVSVTVTLKEKYVNPQFSNGFKRGFSEVINHAKAFHSSVPKRDPRYMSSSDIVTAESEKRTFLVNIQKLANKLFGDDRDIVFVPAGRSLLAILSDQLSYIHPHKLDDLMRAFIERINASKGVFSRSLDDLVKERRQLTQEKIDFETLGVAQAIIRRILKGTYRCDSDGEKLFFTPNKYTRLDYASSGQQEAIWILLLIFLILLENKSVFIVFEEPEAHLYPEAQKDAVELMALLSNVSNNQLVVTTHSPYILSSFNNLLYASAVATKSKRKVEALIDKRLWINPQRLSAYFVAEGGMKSIVDEETKLLKTEAIDSASIAINAVYDKLFILDDE